MLLIGGCRTLETNFKHNNTKENIEFGFFQSVAHIAGSAASSAPSVEEHRVLIRNDLLPYDRLWWWANNRLAKG